MISSATGPHTFAASAYCVQYKYRLRSCERAHLLNIKINQQQQRRELTNNRLTSVPARSFASDTYILYTVGRSCERVWPPVAEEIILCSLKVIYIVCYIARVPVCVCDGRTILFCPVLGVFCDNDAQRELTNNKYCSSLVMHSREKRPESGKRRKIYCT